MGLKIETWNIAFRKRGKNLFDREIPFKVIKNGYKGWYADPFLFDYNGETFLFAEFYSYRLRHGIISVSKYDDKKECFSKFKPIIVENYHLSYPVVFEYQNQIYMMPESNETNSLYMYKCKSFPYEWEKLPAVMNGIRLVDTTPYIINDSLYAITLKLKDDDSTKGELLLLKFDGLKFNISEKGVITDDMGIARPGGNFFINDNKLFYPSQNCEGSYGKALNFINLTNFPIQFNISLIDTIYPKDITLLNYKKPEGIHTYNFSDKIEVIDLKYYKNSYYRLMFRLLKGK